MFVLTNLQCVKHALWMVLSLGIVAYV
jgi:hypothetical protein